MKALILSAAVVAAASCSPSLSPGEVVSRVAPPGETSPQVYTLHVRTSAGREAVAVTPGEYKACRVGSTWPGCAEGAR